MTKDGFPICLGLYKGIKLLYKREVTREKSVHNTTYRIQLRNKRKFPFNESHKIKRKREERDLATPMVSLSLGFWP